MLSNKLVRFSTGLIPLCFSAALFAQQGITVKVEGITQAKLKENVNLYLQTLDGSDIDDAERYQQLVSENINKALRAYGYYNSQINFQLKPEKNKTILVANVNVGEPVKIAATDVEITGAATQDEAFQTLEKKIPAPDSVLNHEDYENYKGALQKLALQRGYFDANFPVHQLEVMPSTKQAWWRLTFDSGERYRYGEIRFENAQIREDYLRNMLNIQSGEYYLINDVSALTNNYIATNWFQSVLIQPEVKEKTKLIDINVLMYPKKKNSMEVGIGYSSDVGPRLQLGWTKPWLNDRGHSLRTNLYLSSPNQTFEATYKMPLLKNPLTQYYEFSAGVENEKIKDTDTLAATLAALRYWNNPTGWQYSLGARVRYDSFTQADVQDKTLLFYPTASLSRSRFSGGIFPDRADSLSLTVDWGRKLWLSDVNFFSVRASAGWIKTFATNHRFLTRGEIGYLNTADIQRIPPALRFFAGGDRSVRGYGYKKISPTDPNGKLIGASRLLTGTLEYQYQVVPDWWAATFVDAGLAANSYSRDALHYGAGVGVRWASPVGAIKLDIATPIHDKDNNKNIQFYIGLGAEL